MITFLVSMKFSLHLIYKVDLISFQGVFYPFIKSYNLYCGLTAIDDEAVYGK